MGDLFNWLNTACYTCTIIQYTAFGIDFVTQHNSLAIYLGGGCTFCSYFETSKALPSSPQSTQEYHWRWRTEHKGHRLLPCVASMINKSGPELQEGQKKLGLCIVLNIEQVLWE